MMAARRSMPPLPARYPPLASSERHDHRLRRTPKSGHRIEIELTDIQCGNDREATQSGDAERFDVRLLVSASYQIHVGHHQGECRRVAIDRPANSDRHQGPDGRGENIDLIALEGKTLRMV